MGLSRVGWQAETNSLRADKKLAVFLAAGRKKGGRGGVDAWLEVGKTVDSETGA